MTTTTKIDRTRWQLPIFARALLVIVSGLWLTSCVSPVDESQARACRAVLPALHAADTRIAIQSVAAGPPPRTIRVDYRARASAGPDRGHFVLCQFAEAGLGLRKTEITALRTEHRALTGASLYFLKRFWLDEPDAEMALPEPPPRAPWLGSMSAPGALFLQHIASALPMIMLTGLLACAYALIYGLAGRILLVFGEFALLGAAATSLGVAIGEVSGLTAPLGLLTLGLACVLWSAVWVSVVSVRSAILPVLQRPGHHVIIVSVGLALFLSEAVRLAQGTGRRWLSPVWNHPIVLARGPDFSATITVSAILVALTALVLSLGVVLFMQRSSFGRAWRAASDDALAASLMGINLDRLVMQSFVMAAGLAAICGFLLSVHIGGMGYSGGAVFGLKALVGAILGGIGSVSGALAGGLLLGALEGLWPVFMPIEWRDPFVFALLSGLLVMRPGGLSGYGALVPRQV